MSHSWNEPLRDEVSLEVLGPLVERIEHKFGAAKLDQIAVAAGIEPPQLRAARGWASASQVGIVLAEAEELFPDSLALRRAIGPRGDSARLGWLRRWTCTVDGGYARAAAAAATRTTVGRLSIEREARGHQLIRWEPGTAGMPERFCQIGAGWLEAVPLGWGLPRAQLTERRCVRRGDDRCEYEVRHLVHPTLLGAVVGLLGAAALVVGLHLLGQSSAPAPSLVLLATGILLGHSFELERTARANVRAARSAQRELEGQLQREAEAHREANAAEQRQHEWGRLLEQELATRSDALERITEQINLLQRRRKARLRGFSHDVRNPLTAIRTTVAFLQEELEQAPDHLGRALDDLEAAADRLEELLAHLLRTASTDSGVAQRAPEVIEIPTLAHELRGRLRALVHGRSVATDVVLGTSAPHEIKVEPHRFNRIIDNLMTNAVKYTERGSILVTLDGTASTLLVRVSDTGRGMSPTDLQRIFFGRERTAATESAAGSWGLGLGVVVRLLGELGGELHVESAPGRGSTFEARLPTAPPAALAPVLRTTAPDDSPPSGEVHAARPGDAVEMEPARAGSPAADERAGVALVGPEPFDVLCRRIVHLHEASSGGLDA